MHGKVVYKGKTKSGEDFIIRYPTPDDAIGMCEYINILSKEQTFIRFQGEQESLENETKYLLTQLERIESGRSVQLLIVQGDRVMGNSSVDMKDKTESHEGVFGISIAKKLRGEGIGKLFMKLVLEEAEKNLPKLQIITLGVFGDNDLAYSMYQGFGFKEYGRLPGGSKHKDKYVDHAYMYKRVKE